MRLKGILLLVLSVPMLIMGTSFNYNTALINAPTGEVLPSLGYYISVMHATSFSKDIFDAREGAEEDANINFAYHIPINAGIFKLNLEAGLTIYSMFSKLPGQNQMAGNVKLQIIEDPTDRDYDICDLDFDKNPVYKFLPSVAIGLRNITAEKYLTSVGTIPPFEDENGNIVSGSADEYNTDITYNNSFYLALSKKFYIGDFYIKGHLGWGSGLFQGIKKVSRNVGMVFGVSTGFFIVNKLSPLEVMFDFDGNKYSLGARWIYNNDQLLDLAQDEGVRRFIPGFIFNLAVTDVDEAFRTYETAGWSPKIEFGMGITNSAYLRYAKDDRPVVKREPVKKEPKKVVKKPEPKKEVVKREPTKKEPEKKMTEEESRKLAMERALEARKKAEEARRQAMAAQQAQPSVGKSDIEKIFSAAVKPSVEIVEERNTIVFVPKSVRFRMNSSDLLPIANGSLDEIGNYLKANPNVKFEISGFTDEAGEKNANINLSKQRADVVKKYLVDKFGIAGDRLTTKGMGDQNPRFDASTPLGKAQNRRIEFSVIN